jgi:hypothetical protein
MHGGGSTPLATRGARRAGRAALMLDAGVTPPGLPPLEILDRFHNNSVSMRTGARLFAAIAAIATLVDTCPALAASPPPDLVEMERQVSLELAHVRDSGPTDPVERKQLFDANQLEQNGEAAIKSGDYKSAEDSLLRAREILRHLREISH